MWKEGLLQISTVFGGLEVSRRWVHKVLVTASAVTDFAILFDFQLVACQNPNRHTWKLASRTVWKVGKWDNSKVSCDRIQTSLLSSSASIRFALLV